MSLKIKIRKRCREREEKKKKRMILKKMMMKNNQFRKKKQTNKMIPTKNRSLFILKKSPWIKK